MGIGERSAFLARTHNEGAVWGLSRGKGSLHRPLGTIKISVQRTLNTEDEARGVEGRRDTVIIFETVHSTCGRTMG